MNRLQGENLSIRDLFPELGQRMGEFDFGQHAKHAKNVLVLGGAGSIGSEIVRLICNNTIWNTTVADSDESRLHDVKASLPLGLKSRLDTFVCDIRDEVSVLETVRKKSWDLVIHAAALKHVPVLEQQPREAYLTNVIGTRNILRALESSECGRFIFVSSDKAANPKSVLGKTKLIGERLTANLASGQVSTLGSKPISSGVVRFGNVFLSRGSVIDTFLGQIKRGEDLTVTSPEMTRYFMDLCDASMLTIGMGVEDFEGIRVLKMGNPISILELAQRLIYFYESESKIEIVGVKPGEKLHEDLISDTENYFQASEKYWDIKFTKTMGLHAVSSEIPSNNQNALIEIQNLIGY